ncbi:hypothetical protein TRFO_03206 [Tritrichomonas foetus]|uniref:Uncharacterized protein n=1 Tax=Tritrichomonas foetus TaxID=1144522 RepID=A0A1J4KX75_9EUKA|nr:hypothetical protein TRFO_03206 [Tritrichomonas foetus]|eukprot:OHT14157.1 hypothetical protein TRFO_03206 [Tritrichomonas foetus]
MQSSSRSTVKLSTSSLFFVICSRIDSSSPLEKKDRTSIAKRESLDTNERILVSASLGKIARIDVAKSESRLIIANFSSSFPSLCSFLTLSAKSCSISSSLIMSFKVLCIWRRSLIFSFSCTFSLLISIILCSLFSFSFSKFTCRSCKSVN